MHKVDTSRRQLLAGLLAGGIAGSQVWAQTDEPASDQIRTGHLTILEDPALRKIANRVVAEVGLAIEKVIGHEADPYSFPLPGDLQSAEQIIWQRFRTFSEERRKLAVAKAAPRMRSSASVRRKLLGDLAAVNLHSPVSIDRQIAQLPFPVGLRMSYDKLRQAGEMQIGVLATAPNAVFAAAPPITSLVLRVHKVRCVDETDGWFGIEKGNDEILLGGTAVDETGQTHEIPHFGVYSNFDDGEAKIYNPPKQFTSFDPREGTAYPKTYFATFVLSEKDGGGTADFINKLFDLVKEKVASYLAAAIGGSIGASGGPLGAVIGAAVGYAVGKIFEILKSAIDDDIFPPQTVSVAIGSPNHRFPGGRLDSLNEVVRFRGHDGLYELTYDWVVA